MKRYLTAYAKARRLRDIPLAALSIMMVALVLRVGLEEFWTGQTPADEVIYTVLAGALLAWLAALPLIHVARRRWRQRLAEKFSAALSACGEDAIPLEALDRVTGVRGASRKLEKLIKKGFLQKLSIDEDAECLRLDNPRVEAPQPAPDDSEAVLARIRRLNDAIEDEAVSRHIERIEAATAGIFRTVRQRPEHAADARKFINYYLPTTLKLLQTYDLMEDQSYQGANITASRRQIEQILGKLVYAVEQQQDKLFRSDALDVDAEISVLETMMAADGLAKREEGR